MKITHCYCGITFAQMWTIEVGLLSDIRWLIWELKSKFFWMTHSVKARVRVQAIRSFYQVQVLSEETRAVCSLWEPSCYNIWLLKELKSAYITIRTSKFAGSSRHSNQTNLYINYYLFFQLGHLLSHSAFDTFSFV